MVLKICIDKGNERIERMKESIKLNQSFLDELIETVIQLFISNATSLEYINFAIKIILRDSFR